MATPDYKGYKNCVDDLNSRQMSNSETYDRALLTLSSAFLGISLTFIDKVVSLSSAESKFLLFTSWGLFFLTVSLTIFSFIYGQSVIKELKLGAKKYFIECNHMESVAEIENCKKEQNTRSEVLSNRLDVFNKGTGVSFIGGVVFITIFVIVNVAGDNKMSDKAVQKPENTRSQPVQTFSQTPQKPPVQNNPPQKNTNQSNKK